MSKKPTPKKKTAKASSRQQYGAFQTKVLKRLSNEASLTTCDNCGEKRKTHHACPECGTYKGRQVLNKKSKLDKIKTIKA